MGKSIRYLFWVLLTVTTLVAVFSGCQKEGSDSKKGAAKADPRYADWKSCTYQNIKIMYPPGHPQESTMTTMAAGYIGAMAKVNQVLGVPPLTDTLLIYYYTGFGQGRGMTGQEYPYADSTSIHFWLPSFYGPTMMQYLLPRWAPDPPRHKFLKHGLISLFDFSGQNYHASTIGYKNAGELISLANLAVDSATNSNEERYESAEAASLCACILADYGPMALRELYLSNMSFDSSVSQVLGLSLDTLQMRWLNFVKENVPKDSLHE
jgi:hypothetical protein